MPDYEEYIEKYAKQNNITIEEARQHALVQNVKSYYENRDNMPYAWW